jgi:glycosyltransferase involved in cell wall biosynthesis
MSNTSKNILYLSYDGLSDSLGQSQILPYILGLSSRGYSFTIVSFEKEKPGSIIFEKVKADCETYNIHWVPLQYHRHPPVISTVYDIYLLRRTVKRLHREKNFALVHCRSYIAALVGLQLKRKYGLKFIFDMRGFWADERVDGGLWNLRNPLYKIIYTYFKRKELSYCQESDTIISLTQSAREIIKSWGVTTEIAVIPCCVDTDLFDPAKIDKTEVGQLRSELGIDVRDFVLVYLGSWGTWYLTAEMLDFFSVLKAKFPNSKFLIISPDRVGIESYPFRKDVLVRKVSREKVPLYVSLASASVCFIKPSFSKKASSATKMGELLAMNVPIITNAGWGDVETIREESTLYFKDNFILQNFVFDKTQSTREYCLRKLSLESGRDRYSSVYKALLKNETNP